MPTPSITSITPGRAITGGRIAILGSGFPVAPELPNVSVGTQPARIVFASSSELGVVVSTDESGTVPVHVDGAVDEGSLSLGVSVATGLHQVDNPVVRPGGQPVSDLQRHAGDSRCRCRSSASEPVAHAKASPRASRIRRAWRYRRTGALFVSSRFEGAVYRLTEDGSRRAVCLGPRHSMRPRVRRGRLACSLAIDPERCSKWGEADSPHLRDAAFEHCGLSSRAGIGWPVCDRADAVCARRDLSDHLRRRRVGGPRRIRPAAGHRVLTRRHPSRVEALAGASGFYRLPAGGPRIDCRGSATGRRRIRRRQRHDRLLERHRLPHPAVG